MHRARYYHNGTNNLRPQPPKTATCMCIYAVSLSSSMFFLMLILSSAQFHPCRPLKSLCSSIRDVCSTARTAFRQPGLLGGTADDPHTGPKPCVGGRLVDGISGGLWTVIWGFPKIRGTLLGVPIIRTTVFGGLYWGPLILGNYHLSPGEVQNRLSTQRHQRVAPVVQLPCLWGIANAAC